MKYHHVFAIIRILKSPINLLVDSSKLLFILSPNLCRIQTQADAYTMRTRPIIRRVMYNKLKLTPSKMPQSGPAAPATSLDANQAAVVAAATLNAFPFPLTAFSDVSRSARFRGSKVPMFEEEEDSLLGRAERDVVVDEMEAVRDETGLKAPTVAARALRARNERATRMVVL